MPTNTPVPTSTATPTHTPTPTGTPTPREVAVAHLSRKLQWIDKPPDPAHSDAAKYIIDTWLRDAHLGDSVTAMNWVANGIIKREVKVLESLLKVATIDVGLARRIFGFAWVAESADVGYTEGQALESLEKIGARDLRLGMLVTSYAWLGDDVTLLENDALASLDGIGALDSMLAELLGSYAWVTDGISKDEGVALDSLRNVGTADLALAKLVANYPWVDDDMTSYELTALGSLGGIATVPTVLRLVVSYQWVIDDISFGEQWALTYLSWMAQSHPELAQEVAGLPWVAGDMNVQKQDVLGLLSVHDPERVRYMMGIAGQTEESLDSTEQSSLKILHSLLLLLSLPPDTFEKLVAQPWFADGLDEEEAAFLTILEFAFDMSPSTYHDLAHSHFTESATISLPLTGEVNLWAFSNIPFPPEENLVATMGEVIRTTESFLGVPFPTNTVVLLIVSDTEEGFGPGGYVRDFMWLTRSGSNHVYKRTVYHEISHYYYGFGPPWLLEGGANLLEAYTSDKMGILSFEERPRGLEEGVARCAELGAINIQRLTELQPGDFYYRCNYPLGEHFLTSVFGILGEEAMASALREFYLLSDEGQLWISSATLYRVFLKNTPEGSEEEFRELFRRLHGGPIPDP